MKKISQIIKKYLYSNFPLKIRYSPVFLREYKFLKESINWSYNSLLEYQWRELKKIINYAYNNSQYYNELFKYRGITPDKIKDFDDYQKIPLLTKEIIRKNLDKMITMDKKKLFYVTTGGTTGIPLGFYLEKGVTYEKTRAFEWRQFNEGGYFPRNKIAIFRGRIIENNFYQFNKVENSIYFSVADMKKDNMNKYVEILEKFMPEHIRAYPSSIEKLSKYILKYFPEFNKEGFINSIFTTSEILLKSQRMIIERAFRAKIFDKYGNSEQCTIIGECSLGNYHEYMEYGYSEILDENDKVINSGSGRLISTSFVNYGTPFLRYDIGDILTIDDNQKCSCGMNHRKFKKILGRTHDFLYGKNGETISVALINTHSSAFDNVEKFRIVQDIIGRAVIELVRDRNYNQSDDKKILKEFTHRSTNKINFEIKYVDDIPLKKSGKFSFIVNNVKKNGEF